MEKEDKILNLSCEPRQTYIILFEENDVRYIFNRSIPWDVVMNRKNIQKILDLLGKDAVNNFFMILNYTIEKMTDDINHLTRTFKLDTKIFTILEVHPEWENYYRENQSKIETRKDELCKKYDAVKRKDKLIDPAILDKYIGNIIKNEFKKWLIDIYDAIADYSKLIKEEIVHTTLGATKEKLLNDINKLRSENKALELEIERKKKKLKNQNYVIEKFNEYINNNIDIEQLKRNILYNKEC